MSVSTKLGMRRPKPAWGLLYAVFLLAVVLLVAAHFVASSPAGRQAAEGLASLLVLGVLALWVRANRLALASYDEDGEDGDTLRVSVVYAPPSDRATGTRSRRERVQVSQETRPRTGDVDKEDVTCYARSKQRLLL